MAQENRSHFPIFKLRADLVSPYWTEYAQRAALIKVEAWAAKIRYKKGSLGGRLKLFHVHLGRFLLLMGATLFCGAAEGRGKLPPPPPPPKKKNFFFKHHSLFFLSSVY